MREVTHTTNEFTNETKQNRRVIKMPTYLFNVQTTIEIEANTQEDALQLIGTDKADIRDEDIMLVEVSE